MIQLPRPSAMSLTLPSDTEIRIERRFNAPRHMVFAAFTEPALIRRWLLGPPGWTLEVCECEARVGGGFRYVWRGEKGVMGMRGTFHEVDAPRKLVNSEVFDEAWYPGEAIGTLELEETSSGQTQLTQWVRYQSQQARDMAASSGMADGMECGYQRLEDLLQAGTE